jgi:hypothetical protein
MSGIIGGAGSKSGVIGETELDYETGVWTPTFDNMTLTPNSGGWVSGTYQKIDNLVIAMVHIMNATSTGSNSSTMFLPFTNGPKRGTVNGTTGYGAFSYDNTTGIVTENNNYVTFLSDVAGSGWVTSSLRTTTSLYLHTLITYYI